MSARTIWVSIIVGFLLAGVATQMVLLVSALGDPSFAVEPDYEAKAENWDERQRQEATNRALGWSVDLGTVPAAGRERLVWIQLHDRWGKPIMDGAIELEAFHNARAAHVVRGRPAHERDGRYVATLPVVRPGVWEFRLRIRRDDELLTRTLRKSLARLPETPS